MLGSRPVSVHSDYPGGSATFKTPGRALHQNRAENATAAARTAGKNVFQTPFKQPLGGGTTTPFPRKDGGDAGGKTALRTGARPLGDKTPFPNRPRRSGEGIMQTPFALAPIALDFVPGLTPAPASTCRPSSVRKSTRRSSRGSTGLNLSGIGSALDLGVFQTPRVNGNPWDVEDIDVVLPSTEDKIDEEPDEDDDEIEYMPPKAVGRCRLLPLIGILFISQFQSSHMSPRSRCRTTLSLARLFSTSRTSLSMSLSRRPSLMRTSIVFSSRHPCPILRF
jgi:hypothetical protein